LFFFVRNENNLTMIKFLNFLYKGFAFSKPRFGIKETFWVLLVSLILSPIDTLIIYYIFTNGEFIGFYFFITFIIRFTPFVIVKPFNSKKFLPLYIHDSKQKYWLNAVMAFLLFLIFVGFPGWVSAFFILYL